MIPEKDLDEMEGRISILDENAWEVYDGPGAPKPFKPYQNSDGRGASKPGVWVRRVGGPGQGWCIGISVAPFMAHSRTDLPRTISEVRRVYKTAREAESLGMLHGNDDLVRFARRILEEET